MRMLRKGAEDRQQQQQQNQKQSRKGKRRVPLGTVAAAQVQPSAWP
jgi:hypothetical protein